MHRRPMLTYTRLLRGRLFTVWFTPLSGPHSTLFTLIVGRRGTIVTGCFREGRPPRTKHWRRPARKASR